MNNMIVEEIKRLAGKDKIIFKRHALERMIERHVTADDVISVVTKCEIIEDYSENGPYPSFLCLGYSGKKVLHVVISIDTENEILFIITVYEPSMALWENNFKTRRKK
jgi:hypothetical protein